MGHPPAAVIFAIMVVATVTTIGFWVTWLPVGVAMLKTGRLLAQCHLPTGTRPRSRCTGPGLNGMLAVGLIMIVATGMLVAGAIARM